MRYWIGVACREHVLRGVEASVAQLGHGKPDALRRMRPGDFLVYYAGKERLEGGTPCQRFVAAGRVLPGEPYQVEQSPDFRPWRRDVAYLKGREAEIRPLLDELGFIRDPTRWGVAFRFGHLEIAEADFRRIAQAMGIAQES